jgi:hypothetical protein
MMYRPQPEATENETVAEFGIRPLVFANHSRPFIIIDVVVIILL